MLAFLIIRAKEDMYIKNDAGKFLFTKNKIYYGKLHGSYIRIYDNNDNGLDYIYFHSSFNTGRHYSVDFDYIPNTINTANDRKHFCNIRTGNKLITCFNSPCYYNNKERRCLHWNRKHHKECKLRIKNR